MNFGKGIVAANTALLLFDPPPAWNETVACLPPSSYFLFHHHRHRRRHPPLLADAAVSKLLVPSLPATSQLHLEIIVECLENVLMECMGECGEKACVIFRRMCLFGVWNNSMYSMSGK